VQRRKKRQSLGFLLLTDVSLLPHPEQTEEAGQGDDGDSICRDVMRATERERAMEVWLQIIGMAASEDGVGNLGLRTLGYE
jgi:hypothetical protein